MEKDCIFCSILAGEIPAPVLYQDDRVFVLRDINPKAPTHLLVIPKEHIPTIADLKDEQIVDRLMLRAGCPIMIRMGYHNDPRKLDMVFLGAVSELQAQEGEIEIVAQGWGAQFNNPVTAKREKIGAWGWRKAHFPVKKH